MSLKYEYYLNCLSEKASLRNWPKVTGWVTGGAELNTVPHSPRSSPIHCTAQATEPSQRLGHNAAQAAQGWWALGLKARGRILENKFQFGYEHQNHKR